jgi:hypothetical protein
MRGARESVRWCVRLATTSALLAAGCSPAIVGEWQTPVALSYYQNGTVNHPNRLTTGSDGTGKADLYFLLTADPEQLIHLARFEVSWEEVGDTTFELAMACFQADPAAPDASSQAFTMSCQATIAPSDDQPDSMACTGDGAWTDYSFVWEEVLDG